MKNKDKFSIGDRVIFHDTDDLHLITNGSTATVISEEVYADKYFKSLRQTVKWDRDGTESDPVVKYLRKLTKLEKALK